MISFHCHVFTNGYNVGNVNANFYVHIIYNPHSPYEGKKNHYVFLIPYTLHYKMTLQVYLQSLHTNLHGDQSVAETRKWHRGSNFNLWTTLNNTYTTDLHHRWLKAIVSYCDSIRPYIYTDRLFHPHASTEDYVVT